MAAPRIVALVPMRHFSERVPGKTVRPFGGVPLYQHIIRTLIECPCIDEIAIDTDSPVVLAEVARLFPSVRLIERPAHLTDGAVPMNEVLLHDTSLVKGDYYLQTHCTNPLLRGETINRAVELLLAAYPEYDSLFSVTRVQARFWDQLTRAINHNPAILMRTQDMPPVYEENSCLYIFKRQTLETRRNRIGERPLMFEIERDEAWDIDEELDFRVAELMYLDRERVAS